jgi:hypothetical protein
MRGIGVLDVTSAASPGLANTGLGITCVQQQKQSSSLCCGSER